MPGRLLVSALGAVIEIDVSRRDPSFHARTSSAWTDARLEGDRAPDAVVTDRDALADDSALSMLSTDVTLRALEHGRDARLWMLHAAGLADERGRVVALSAPSGTGKTTAARHLAQRYAYVSDESVGIDEHGVVVAYRKPLSVIVAGSPDKAQIAPSTTGGEHPLPENLRIARIVVLDRSDDGPVEPEVEELGLVEALQALAPQTSYLGDLRAPLELVDALIAASGGAVRLRYRDVDTIDAHIDALFASAPVEQVSRPTSVALDVEPGADGTFTRAAVVDARELDDGLLIVLQRASDGASLRVLDGIGPAIWRAAEGRTADEITSAVIDAFGAPDDADPRALVDAALAALVDDGVIRRGAASA